MCLWILTRRKKILEMPVLISSKRYMVLNVNFIMYLRVSICNTRWEFENDLCKPFTKNLTKYAIFDEFLWQIDLFSWKSKIFLGGQFFRHKVTRLNILQTFKLHHNTLSPYFTGGFDGGSSIVGVSCELKCWTHLSQSSH